MKHMKRFIALVFLVTSVLHASLRGQTTGTLRDDLIGTWRLVAAGQRLADGSPRPDPQAGSRGIGYIMYDATGHMCVVIANPDRPAWTAPGSPTDAEVRSAFQGLVAYCGTYETNEQERYVVHHVAADREPHVMGTDRKRLATITGNRLVLRPTPLPTGVVEWTVEWERVGNGTLSSRKP